MTHFDYIIIGAGSGNTLPTKDFDNKTIAIVEKHLFGGTCMNVGCIPTKMYVYAAETAYSARINGPRLNLKTEFHGANWNEIIDRVFHNRIDLIAQGGEAYRRGSETPNITVYDQHARFVSPKTIEVGGEEISGDNIIIATGARPFIPEPIASSGVPYHTNEDIMRLPKQPESLIILGGGFIAMEFAHVFASLGTKVSVVNRSPLLRHLDEDITTRFNDIAAQRYELHIGRSISDVEGDEKRVCITLDDGISLEAEALLVATGRIPNGDQMNLDAAGIRMHEDGRIAVDKYGRTSAEGIWALGDVSSPYQLKHVANQEAHAIRHNLLHPEDLRELPHDNVPSAIFTHPQIATVGMTEAQAREAGYDITVKVQNYGDVAYGWAMEDSTGIVKLIADRSNGQLLGAHYMGPQASTLIQQMITVMTFNLDVREVATKQYWIHPALPEVTENALLGLEF